MTLNTRDNTGTGGTGGLDSGMKVSDRTDRGSRCQSFLPFLALYLLEHPRRSNIAKEVGFGNGLRGGG